MFKSNTQVLAANGDTDQAIGLIKKADQLDPSNQVSYNNTLPPGHQSESYCHRPNAFCREACKTALKYSQ